MSIDVEVAPTVGIDPDEDTPLARASLAAMEIRSGELTMPRPRHRRVFSVANQKGGVGKTTTTVNIGVALALAGLHVLVIDLDPQGNASTALGVERKAGTPSVYDVLLGDITPAEAIQTSPDAPRLGCIPATIDLAGAEIELVSMSERETRLKKAIAAIDTYYDYILVDCPPSLGLLTVNAMAAVDEVLIPIQCEYYALEGLGQLLRNIGMVQEHLNRELVVSTILLTMYDGRTKLADQVANEVRHHFGDMVLRTTIPQIGQGVRGAGVRSVGDDLRPRFPRRHELPGRGARDRRTRDEGAGMSERPRANNQYSPAGARSGPAERAWCPGKAMTVSGSRQGNHHERAAAVSERMRANHQHRQAGALFGATEPASRPGRAAA